MATDIENAPQTEKSMSERLKRAYERVSPRLRPDAIVAFCEYHRIKPKTFSKKRCGDRIATEQECEWMEDWKPTPTPQHVN